MPLTVYLVIAVMTVASAILRVVERWIQSRYQVKLAREYDRAMVDALLRMRAGYGLEHQGPDGSRWLVSLSSPGQMGPGEVVR